MRKEFEENEEKSKESENNLEMQDDIDDETFRKILEEEFIEREKQIEEALFADKDFEDFVPTDEEVQASYEELMRRFEREKKESTEFSGELVPDEKLVHELALKEKLTDVDEDENADNVAVDTTACSDEKKKVLSLDELRERRKKSDDNDEHEKSDPKITEIRRKNTGGRRHRLGRVVGMAAVAVACVFAASMTSEANRTYLVNSVRIWSGDDTKTVVDNDGSNEKANVDENEAIADIEEQLEVKVPIFYYRPYGMRFLEYTLDKWVGTACIEYIYNDNYIVLYIDKQGDSIASKINSIDGSEENIQLIQNNDISIQVKKITCDDPENENRYSAEWEFENTQYLLSAKIDEDEIKKIIEKMKF